MPKTHELTPGAPIKMADLISDGAHFCDDREQAEKEFLALRERLVALEPKLYADASRSLLVIFQAMDAGGKDSATRKVFTGVNPQGVRVVSFKQPTEEELAHDFLWRIHKQTPRRGKIVVFNRSQYEDVLVVRVEKLAPKSVWQARFEQINQFEEMLTAAGTRILKFYLHISKDEQKERFQSRLDEPSKNWKFSPDDLAKRAQWDDYQDAYEDVLKRCTTPWAPWHVIPADRKWYRNLAVCRTIVDALETMDLRYPEPTWKPGEYKID
ncbi:polyphosphate kinase 2 family protein [Lignipirellula cremea]|uniref:Polyphosphate kinase 2 (PPK2) n=1 Tax=Lignipirellula cremea TaxID=2528010 RepID=A0A518DS85_9BACT|nr:polyphosphate kinase 2 family protein [Lignipirellula cremea]QDU94648.1 Polyphosphate kinase 2 (PPK2) [Lignipirellula cremea]